MPPHENERPKGPWGGFFSAFKVMLWTIHIPRYLAPAEMIGGFGPERPFAAFVVSQRDEVLR